jgi:threonine dehydratase
LVIAGQGTIGLEIADEIVPDVVLVPVGGGGLLAWIAIAIAARAPAAEMIAVEAAGSTQLSISLAAGAPVSVARPVDTIADGLATGNLGRLPFDVIRQHVRRVVTVDDFEIGEALLLMLERMKLLAEGAGAAALAGALKIRSELQGRRIVIVVSGGNIDTNLLDRIIGHGLAKAGRLMLHHHRFTRPSRGIAEAASADRRNRRERPQHQSRSGPARYPDWQRACDARAGNAQRRSHRGDPYPLADRGYASGIDRAATVPKA